MLALCFMVLGVASQGYGYWVYVDSIKKKVVEPKKATWTIVAFQSSIILISSLFAGAGFGIIGLIVEPIGSIWIAKLAFKHKIELEPTDYLCMASAGIGAILGLFFKSGEVTIILTSFVGILSLIPTLKSSSVENKKAWIIWAGSSLLIGIAVLLVTHFSLAFVILMLYEIAEHIAVAGKEIFIFHR